MTQIPNLDGNDKFEVDISKHKSVLILVFIIIVIIITYGAIVRSNIFKRGLYTIATITEITPGRSGTTISIIYNVNGRNYKQYFMPGSSFDRFIGRKIYVKFLDESPEKSIYLDITVPECVLKVQSKSVWKKIPDCD